MAKAFNSPLSGNHTKLRLLRSHFFLIYKLSLTLSNNVFGDLPF